MPNINTVPASAGAQWLLDAFALLRRQPLAFASLGLTWGSLALLTLGGSLLHPTLGLLLQLLLAMLGPFLTAGLLHAVREADAGRPALPGHLWQGLRLGRGTDLLLMLLPQVVAGVLLGTAFLLLVGTEGVRQFIGLTAKVQEIQQAGGQPDPSMFEDMDIPVVGVLLWLLLAIATAVAVALTKFIAVPQVAFGGVAGLQALRTSLLACLRNLPAVIVCLLLEFITLLGIFFAVQVLSLVVQLTLGAAAAVLVMNLLLMAVLMPLMATISYFAWKQLLRDAAAPQAAVAEPSQIEV